MTTYNNPFVSYRVQIRHCPWLSEVVSMCFQMDKITKCPGDDAMNYMYNLVLCSAKWFGLCSLSLILQWLLDIQINMTSST